MCRVGKTAQARYNEPHMAKPAKKSQAKAGAKKSSSLAKPLQYLLIIGGAIGLYCSYILTLDKIKLLENPAFQPGCNLNPVISCGDVMSSSQGSVFGFPNSGYGLAMFAGILTIGVALLAGATFKRWFWLGLQAGLTLGLATALWLLYESMYAIKALCPYCLSVDVVVITLVWYTTLYLIESRMLILPNKLQKAAAFARRHHLDILISIFVLIFAFILHHFWYYYGQYFS